MAGPLGRPLEYATVYRPTSANIRFDVSFAYPVEYRPLSSSISSLYKSFPDEMLKTFFTDAIKHGLNMLSSWFSDQSFKTRDSIACLIR